jgi:orotidine-5'-phosphate decarboxylase
MPPLIQLPRSIIPACDVDVDGLRRILESTADIDKVGAYKIGAALGLAAGLPAIVELVRKYTDKPVIYDHQKAGTDIPETAPLFAKTLRAAGVAAYIIFPHAGPITQRAWIEAAYENELRVIVGGHMTHAQYLVSQNGYIADGAVHRIYELACDQGVTDYVLPGNKPDAITQIRQIIVTAGIQPVFYSPGLIAQGG